MSDLTIAITSLILGLVLYLVLVYLLTRWSKRKKFAKTSIPSTIRDLRDTIIIFLLALYFRINLPIFSLPDSVDPVATHLVNLWVIGAVGWLAIRLLPVFREVIMTNYQLGGEDNLEARKIYTQIRILERVLMVAIVVIAVAAMLMTFDKIKELGISLLASAGIVGVILGFAAQKSIATLFAGLQIAITQPIRIDDVVIVEGEWGRIEEITLTYVVIRIWDQRRLVVPVTYFLETPFQNWTRTTSELIGAVYIYSDYAISIEPIRQELTRILEETKLWDKRVGVVQVTNTNESVIEVRALMSARNSSDTWDLRCLVREKLIDFMQQNYPNALPRVRVKMEKEMEIEEG
jgi:small-conductance mechanosensitive channel